VINDHYLVVVKVREKLSVDKQHKSYDMKRFNLKKVVVVMWI